MKLKDLKVYQFSMVSMDIGKKVWMLVGEWNYYKNNIQCSIDD
ncbi:MAG: hypothetical protein ACUZ8N_00630 [Candidatus Scalindua sp.]